MKKLVNLYNQKGAGPKNIALNFINELLISEETDFIILIPNLSDFSNFSSTDDVIFIQLLSSDSFFVKSFMRLYIELLLTPYLVIRYKIKNILAFGNFLFSPVSVFKTVLLHHPYLVDDDLFKKLSFKNKLTESLKRATFYFTMINVNCVVVQSHYMKKKLMMKYPKQDFIIEIIGNPISHHFGKIDNVESVTSSRTSDLSNCLRLLYVSRYYPHKNHVFLLSLSKELHKYGINHVIDVTIDPSIVEAQVFLNDRSKKDIYINNLTELSQTELTNHYINAHAFIFPSKSETFGNPLIEAMCYGLPVIVPNLEYAHSVVDEAGIYYEPDNASDCVEKISATVMDLSAYKEHSVKSLIRFDHFMTPREWFQQYLVIAFCNE